MIGGCSAAAPGSAVNWRRLVFGDEVKNNEPAQQGCNKTRIRANISSLRKSPAALLATSEVSNYRG
jgi:hypothetical protein